MNDLNVEVGYVAVKQFKVGYPGWEKYARFSRLNHLIEVIWLSDNLILELTDEDWNHRIQYKCLDPLYNPKWALPHFKEVEYLQSRVCDSSMYQILAVVCNPTEQVDYLDPRFKFVGYDLLDPHTGISALTNCGGFDGAFMPEQLSPQGLLVNLSDAQDINIQLQDLFPDELHAQCDIWAIWRMAEI